MALFLQEKVFMVLAYYINATIENASIPTIYFWERIWTI